MLSKLLYFFIADVQLLMIVLVGRTCRRALMLDSTILAVVQEDCELSEHSDADVEDG